MNAATMLSVRPLPPRFEQAWRAAIVIVSVMLVASFLILVQLFSDGIEPPETIDRITVTNPSELDIDVDVSKPSTTGWLLIGTARPDNALIAELVIDQGATWRFRFHSATHYGGTLRVSREALEGADWHVEVPDQVVTRLQRAGARPAPRE